MKSLLVSAVAAQQILEEPKKNDQCFVLALSSGDENCVYQAGVLDGLLQAQDPDVHQYDYVTGMSGGALNAVILANATKGEEAQAASEMLSFWKDAANTKLYKEWVGGVTSGLFVEGGLYNNEPMLTFLQDWFNDLDFQRPVNVGITNAENGELVDWNETNMVKDYTYQVLFASLNMAGAFPPAQVLDGQWFDGSAVYDMDIFTGVNRCKDAGYAESDIVVDVIMTSAPQLKDVDATNFKTLNMLARYLQISGYYSAMDGVLRAQFAYKDVTFRHMVMPSASIGSSIKPFNNDEAWMQTTYDLGVTDGKAADGDMFQHATEMHLLMKRADKRIAHHTLDTFIEAKAAGEFEDLKTDPYVLRYTAPRAKKVME